MSGWAKVLLWTWILLACAGVGAFVASRSNPFPPEVRDDAETPTDSPSSEAPPAPWVLSLVSRTTRSYRVGGSCTSDWRMRARIEVSAAGEVQGRGVAHLLSGARCDFPTAQVQADAIAIRVGGRRVANVLDLRLRATEVRPRGAQDLGGFARTLSAMRLSIEERPGAEVQVPTQVEDPEDEIHVARTTLRLTD